MGSPPKTTSCSQTVDTRLPKTTKQWDTYKNKTIIRTKLAKIKTQWVSQTLSLARPEEDIQSNLLVGFTKLAKAPCKTNYEHS